MVRSNYNGIVPAQIGMRGTGQEILIGDTGAYAPNDLWDFMQRLRDAGPQARRAVGSRIEEQVKGIGRIASSDGLYRAHGQLPEFNRLDDALEDMVYWLRDVDPECATFFERLRKGVTYGELAKTVPQDELYDDIMDGLKRRFRSYPKRRNAAGETVRDQRRGGDEVDFSLAATWVWHGIDRAQHYQESRVWLVSRDADVIRPALHIKGLVHEVAYDHGMRTPASLYFSPAASVPPTNMLSDRQTSERRNLERVLAS